MVHTVKDHSSALACCKGLDACAKKVEKLFPNLLQADDDQITQDVVRKLGAHLHQRLLRRSEHWKAEAHRTHQAVLKKNKPDTSVLAATGKRRREIVGKYRVKHSLTVDQLAHRCHTTPSAIHGMMRGDRTRFGPDSLSRFLKVIGVSVQEWDGK